jgi:hypothetical protein
MLRSIACTLIIWFALLSTSLPTATAGEPVNAPQWQLIGVSTDLKSVNKLLFGRVVIKVDSEDPQETLATATLVAKKLLQDRTLGALQVWAYPKSFPTADRMTAWVEYSTDPDFGLGNKWIFRAAPQVGLTPETVDFNPDDIRINGMTLDPTNAISAACKGSYRNCTVGKTTL